MLMHSGDKYLAIKEIVEGFYETCPANEAANAALGVVISIAAVINMEAGDTDCEV